MLGGRKYEIFLEMQQHNGLLFTKSNIQGGPYGSITTVFLTKLGGGFVYNTRISAIFGRKHLELDRFMDYRMTLFERSCLNKKNVHVRFKKL
jgi:hypothetical protein